MSSDENWIKIKRIFNAALEKIPGERHLFVKKKCAGDETLLMEIESLLSSFDESESFMQGTAVGEVAEVLDRSEQFQKGNFVHHYEIIRLIGAGGMGEVYLAEDKNLERRVAVKILAKKFSRHKVNRNRFIEEAKAASALNHPNILVIHEIGETEGVHFIVSEHIEGRTLRESLNDSTFSLSQTLAVSIQLANALAAAHGVGLMHRDIKPENIMIRPDGVVKVLDFGLAKLVESKILIKGLNNAPANRAETAQGMILGTVSYMSPEQAKGEKIDERTDIFSFGTVLYEIITGKNPFTGDSLAETFANLINAEIMPLDTSAASLPIEIERIVSKALRKNKNERYQTINDLLADLKALQKRLDFEFELERSASPDKPPAATDDSTIKMTFAEIPDLPPNNLTGRHTKLIGREAEIIKVKDLLRDSGVRLLTVTGVGGTGKTTLAQTIARAMLTEFADGVFFVEMAAINNPDLFPTAVAQPLGLKEAVGTTIFEVLKNYCREKQILLVLDNFEQILDAAPQISGLIDASDRLKILITSRVRLHLRAENEFKLTPLALPSAAESFSFEELSNYEAIKLFAERAREANPRFVLTDENIGGAAEICARLDGLPLAIELAAARIKILSLSLILSKLKNSLRLLTGGSRDAPARQQTMRDAIAWSYDLLNDDEKRFFQRLAVFAGGFTFEAAEFIGNRQSSNASRRGSVANFANRRGEDSSFDVLDALTALVEQNLLVSKEQEDGAIRFRMLEVVREYALEALEANGEEQFYRRVHADYFLDLGEQAEPQIFAAQAGEWLNRLEAEYDNLRTALVWLLSRNSELAARLAAAIRNLWIHRYPNEEGRLWLEAVLNQENENLPMTVHFKLLNGFGVLLRMQGDFERAKRMHETGLSNSRTANDRRQMIQSLNNLGIIAVCQQDFRKARTFVEEGLSIARGLDDKFWTAQLLLAMGDLARLENNNHHAALYLKESLKIFQQIGSDLSVCFVFINLGAIAYEENDYESARAYFVESLTKSYEMGNKLSVSYALDGMAALAFQPDGKFNQAVQLAGAADYLLESNGYRLEAAERQFRDNYLTKLRAALSDEVFQSAFEKGRKLKMQEILWLANVAKSSS